MDLKDVATERIQTFEFEIPTLGMLAPNLFPTLLGLLAPEQMLAIVVIIHHGRSTIREGTLRY